MLFVRVVIADALFFHRGRQIAHPPAKAAACAAGVAAETSAALLRTGRAASRALAGRCRTAITALRALRVGGTAIRPLRVGRAAVGAASVGGTAIRPLRVGRAAIGTTGVGGTAITALRALRVGGTAIGALRIGLPLLALLRKLTAARFLAGLHLGLGLHHADAGHELRALGGTGGRSGGFRLCRSLRLRALGRLGRLRFGGRLGLFGGRGLCRSRGLGGGFHFRRGFGLCRGFRPGGDFRLRRGFRLCGGGFGLCGRGRFHGGGFRLGRGGLFGHLGRLLAGIRGHELRGGFVLLLQFFLRLAFLPFAFLADKPV